jgi:hypothetical protein
MIYGKASTAVEKNKHLAKMETSSEEIMLFCFDRLWHSFRLLRLGMESGEI